MWRSLEKAAAAFLAAVLAVLLGLLDARVAETTRAVAGLRQSVLSSSSPAPLPFRCPPAER